MGYSPWGHKESDTTEPHTHTYTWGLGPILHTWEQPPFEAAVGDACTDLPREESLIQTEGRGAGGLAELGVRGVLGWGLGSLRPCGASYTPVPSCSPSAAKRSWEQP